jgi:hypothetical protein
MEHQVIYSFARQTISNHVDNAIRAGKHNFFLLSLSQGASDILMDHFPALQLTASHARTHAAKPHSHMSAAASSMRAPIFSFQCGSRHIIIIQYLSFSARRSRSTLCVVSE